MGENETNNQRDEIYSKAIRAGKRTYFFDVKATKAGEQYITITESKRKFNQDNGTFFYEKHKIFLYKEDFAKFASGLDKVVHFVETGEMPIDDDILSETTSSEDTTPKNEFSDVDFDKLGSENQ